MEAKSRQSGLTLMEQVVVVAVIALLVVFGLPAVRALFKSIESHTGARAMISASLASARAIAAKEQHYAGVRFQKVYNRNEPDPLDPLTAPQYMIFIVHDPTSEPSGTDLANGFRAVEGIEPIKLPDSVGVMDLRIRKNPLNEEISEDELIDNDSKINGSEKLRDTTTFSIIFSPSGKLVIHEVQVRNRNGRKDSSSPQSLDDIFNTKEQITNLTAPCGMFYQDDYADLGLGQEYSRNSFIIYERDIFEETYKKGRAWSDYLEDLASRKIYINPYTGTMINE